MYSLNFQATSEETSLHYPLRLPQIYIHMHIYIYKERENLDLHIEKT